MLKSIELKDPESCLNKAGADEPIFVLRAQDIFASEAIIMWCDLFRRAHAPGGLWKSEKHRQKHNDALACAESFERWLERKIPD